LPPETPVLSAAEVEAFLGRHLILRSWARRRAPAEVEAQDGLQAGEVIRILDALDLEPELNLSRIRMLNLSPREPAQAAGGRRGIGR
jgi:hypothetical protein